MIKINNGRVIEAHLKGPGLDDVLESIEYIRDIGPPDHLFNTLVKEGSDGSETFHIDGDDLASFCWHLNRLMGIFNISSD